MQQWVQCPRCSSPNYVGQPHCRSCGQSFASGAQQQPPVSQQIYSCPNCRQKVQYGIPYCAYCQTPFNWPTQQPQYAVTDTPQKQQYSKEDYGFEVQAAKTSRKSPWPIGILAVVLFVMFGGFAVFAMGIIPQGTQEATLTTQQSTPSQTPPAQTPPQSPPPVQNPPVIAAFNIEPAQVSVGGDVTLVWNVTGANSVTIDQGIGNVSVSGQKGLKAQTTTTYTLTATNSSGTVTKSVTVTTGAAPTDTTPPVISAIVPSNITQSSVTINWTTNEASSSQVEYGTTTTYGSMTTLDTNLVTNHTVALSGLNATTTYHFRVKSKDASGNEAISSDYTFTTLKIPIEVVGTIQNNTVWTANNTYVIYGKVIVPSGVTLTIEPGTAVSFKGHPMTNTQLVIEGTLIAKGTKENYISFKSQTVSGTGGCGSISGLSNSQINMEYCLCKSAGFGFGGQTIIKNCIFGGNQKDDISGLGLSTGNYSVTDNQFNEYAYVNVQSGGIGQISRNRFLGELEINLMANPPVATDISMVNNEIYKFSLGSLAHYDTPSHASVKISISNNNFRCVNAVNAQENAIKIRLESFNPAGCSRCIVSIQSNNIINGKERSYSVVKTGQNNVSFTNNWWGITDEAKIRAFIWDGADSGSCTVNYLPISIAPIPNAGIQ
jgi:hypothetical protein